MAERCASIFFDGGINPTPHLGNLHVNPRQPILQLSIVINPSCINSSTHEPILQLSTFTKTPDNPSCNNQFSSLSIINYQLSSSWQPPHKPRTAHPAIINCHQSCQCCCRHRKAKILAPMEFLPWKKMTTIKYVKMPKIAVKTPPISIKRLKLAHKRLKLATTGENSTVISRIFHACVMLVHFFQIILNPPQRTPRPN